MLCSLGRHCAPGAWHGVAQSRLAALSQAEDALPFSPQGTVLREATSSCLHEAQIAVTSSTALSYYPMKFLARAFQIGFPEAWILLLTVGTSFPAMQRLSNGGPDYAA
ncbi:MAG TPA: hypothetical protein VFV38_28600, partial [Ktedonobacteraceae bacterium]|nr:hypothetical protein [Ktedonobacteraceae bacterium]